MAAAINAEKIFKVGGEVSEVLKKNKVIYDSTLTLSGDEEWFKKIDEDIFYKLKNAEAIDKDAEFIPSDDKITLNFDRLSLEIVKK